MKRQRTIFFGAMPTKAPKKDGANRPVRQRRFAALQPGDLEVRFDNRTATQCGGYGLWHRFAKTIGLNAKLAQHLKLPRGRNGFTAPEAARFLIDAKLLGCERLLHVETLRLDPMLTACAGIDGLANGKTLGAFLKQHEAHHVAALARLNERFNHTLWRRHARHGGRRKRRATDVGLDYDSTTFAVYGKQAGADRGRSFRKKDKPGFQPRFGFLAGLGVVVHQELRPESHGLNKDFLAFHREAVARLPKGARLAFVRGDGALYSQRNLHAFEAAKLTYAVSATLTPHLRAALLTLDEDDWQEGQTPEGRRYSVARLRYCPKTWDGRARTYLISRRLRWRQDEGCLIDGEQYRYFAYVTNRRGSVVDQFRFCVERCSLESFVKEAKLGVHYDRLPCGELTANRAYLQYVRLAYNLSIYFKLHTAPPAVNRWTLDTLRRRVWCIAGNLRRCAGRWRLSLPAWWPYRTVYRQLEARGGHFSLAPP
jgi:hypothetical protein